jgi:hypothetical protein
MDPVTAVANAATAFFNLCATPAGQQMLTELLALNSTVQADIAALLHITAGSAPK